ncbi:alpha/beta hydrolase-fold protein [Natronogracilivirga saccharolytica]|uniref:Esterase family protein n=1 Tax=Natronogracilivirga saccharolytica TaxID=2812953 RepID=A0A8J7SAA5_9BACT|nr:alpha/beta hydrolase-fold protein [Natronogracilivirga saccharolytica]MBP3192926.1 esterase family protein [Natronogracilivirga saccharolytica]
MQKKEHHWQSPSLGRKTSVTVYGFEGTPLLAFPGDAGNRNDWEEHGLIEALSYQIDNGHNMIFCVDSVDQESFFNSDIDPASRIRRYRKYEKYIIDEVLPFIRKQSDDLFVMASGIHMGGYHALNLLFKYPSQIQKVISIGGRVQIRPFMDDYFDDNVYYNNPLEYLPNLEEQSLLDDIKNADIRLVITPDDPYSDINYMLSDILRSKAIDHVFDYWIETGEDLWEIWGDILRRHVP